MSVGTVTLGTPLANGASIDVRMLLGIQQTGTAKLGIVPEGLVNGTGTVLGNVLTLSGTTDGGLSFVPTSVTINQASGQADPAGASPINFTAVFDQGVTGFTGTDVSFAGSTVGGTLVATVTGGPTTFNIAVTGMTGNGTVVASIPSNVVDQTNPASTSTDNTVTLVANTAPSFVGATTTLSVLQNASATDIKSLLHASDSNSGQTLTWSQNTAPLHGTLSFSSATAGSGSADITPGGVITYAPTAGYAGTDSFTVQVSDGTSTATRTISVTVVPVANQASIPTTTAGVTSSLSVVGCSSISSPTFMPAPAGGPASFPYGLLGFTLTGCATGGTATVTVTYSQNLPSGATFYKYQNGSYASYPATLGANSVTFTLTDGGAGDSDGVPNGSISDPGGIGVPGAASVENIPTLSEWGMIILSLLLALGASVAISSSQRVKQVLPPQ
ncbi:IPTL-CTERM sorting domain-containing protein [Acidovorax sp. 1608163]|nr:IPTL-CTERM sorting domain-containing protein [Acidovorax sp. 1608163]